MGEADRRRVVTWKDAADALRDTVEARLSDSPLVRIVPLPIVRRNEVGGPHVWIPIGRVDRNGREIYIGDSLTDPSGDTLVVQIYLGAILGAEQADRCVVTYSPGIPCESR